MSLLHHVVAFKMPLLRLFVKLVNFGPAFAHHHFPVSCLNWVDSLTWWSWVTPQFQAAVSDSINSLLSDYLDYLQGYGCFTQEIINRIHILWLGGQGVVLALTVTDQFSKIVISLSSFKQNWNSAMLIAPRTSAVYRCTWSHWQFHRQCPTSLQAMQHQIMIFRRCFTVRFRHSGLNFSPGNLLICVWA